MNNILIGGAWPYANGSLHIGHIAALLPGDVIARYWRAKGANVFYVSGSDCHGTPVTIRAKHEGRTPKEISDSYHEEFTDVFNKLGFSYDLYGKTSEDWHTEFVKDFHKTMYKSKYILEKTVPQAFCPACNKVLTDRLVVGRCPVCKEKTRGDQCDACGAVFEAEAVLEPECAECGSRLEFRNTKQLYIDILALHKELTALLDSHADWRKNAIAFTKRYIDEGLRERAITRDLDWGIDVPKEGYDDKKIYIWAENVLGYLSASKVVADKKGIPLTEVWGDNARHYYVHGKDNIPFHTIILPSLLLANGEGWHLPDDIISSEYLTLEGRKISTSQNWAIWAKDIVDNYNPDALRYFFISNGPEKRDTDFSWREFVERNNSELLGAYGNLVNRTLAFIVKYNNGNVPDGVLSEEIRTLVTAAYESVGSKIEAGQLKDALDEVFEIVRFSNKYYDTKQPWKTRTEAPKECDETLYNCTWLIANVAVLLKPFLPFSSDKVIKWLGVSDEWTVAEIEAGFKLPEISVLFERLDKSVVDKELEKLTLSKTD